MKREKVICDINDKRHYKMVTIAMFEMKELLFDLFPAFPHLLGIGAIRRDNEEF